MKRITALIVTLALLSGCTAEVPAETSGTPIETTAETTVVSETEVETIFGEGLEPLFPVDTKFKKDTPDFTPVTKTRDISYGNLPCNLAVFKRTGFICPDTESNILYFTDAGGTDSICKLENGVVTELVRQSGVCLNLWDGWLYYICDSEKPLGFDDYLSAASGDIWRYNLTTGENELFYEVDAYTLMISDYGIDFAAGYPRTIEYEGAEATVYETALYRMDFSGENLCKIMDGSESFVYYGENMLVNHNGYKSFYNTESGEYTDILPRSGVNSAAQNGDWLTYIGGETMTSIHAINVITGETRFFEDKAHFQYIYGYAWLDDILYAAVDNGFVKITAERAEFIKIETEDAYENVTANSFMTDGESLYGVTSEYQLYRYDYDENTGMYKTIKTEEILSYEEN